MTKTTYYAKYTVLEFLTTYLNEEDGYRIDGFNPDYINTLSEEAKQNVAISIPPTFDDGVTPEKPVIAIADRAFQNFGVNYTVTSLNLSGATNLKTIGSSAFWNCSAIESALSIPDTVTSIGTSAFSGCSKLTGDVTIPSGVTEIGNTAFRNCASLTSVTIPDSLTTIGNVVFEGCSSLKTVYLPKTPT